jgi:ring-1,2-phenylacetyl-CoA epoxidase subunit PaaD
VVTATTTLSTIRKLVAMVVDPEIPVLTIDDLGVLRSVEVLEGTVVVTITPTYSGCPAMNQIEDDIASTLNRAGHVDHRIETVFAPAWTTDWITEEGHRKLADFGIAPPTPVEAVLCPQCSKAQPRMIAQFGSTACKALMVCSGCGEPFDYFKQH